MIVTLAGHVDHGKTSLVRAITGIDTDTLREEQRRGLTIDLGFAYAVDGEDSGDVLGFVDVPGHHRFIHNMVAGVAAMQYALLTVAADDGPMPQSREHLQILELTGLRQGIVALTKCDRVGPDRVLAAENEIRALVAGTFLEGATIVRTSAQTGFGIPELTRALWTAHRGADRQVSSGQFRLAVDRTFNVRGSGLVVTGTVHAGRVVRNQEVAVFPTDDKARVRSIRAQNYQVDGAGAGDRTALNLAGVDLHRIGRGCWLTETPCPPHRNFAVDLRVVNDFPRPVKHWLPVHVYHATFHTTAHLALLRSGHLAAGQHGDVELVTDEPLCARHGDHIVAGAYHPPGHLASLPAAEQALLNRVRAPLDVDQTPSVGDLAKKLHMPHAELDSGLKSLARRGLLVQVSAKRFYWPERLARVADYAAALAARAPFTVRDFRDASGIGRNIAIEVLEYLDDKGFTRRTGDTRIVVKTFELWYHLSQRA